MNSVLSDYFWFHILQFNCTIGSHESRFINESLYHFKKAIVQRTLEAVKTNAKKHSDEVKARRNTRVDDTTIDGPILNYFGPTVRGCHDFNLQILPYDVMNPTIKDVPLDAIMKLVNVPVNHFYIYTVINLTSQVGSIQSNAQLINNPPLPPYINTNKLKVAKNLLAYMNKMKIVDEQETIDKVLDDFRNTFKKRLNMYEYFKIDPQFDNVLSNWNDQSSEVDKGLGDVIRYLDGTNELTLIGTMDFMSFSRTIDPSGVYPVCDNRFGLGGIIQNQVDRLVDASRFGKMMQR